VWSNERAITELDHGEEQEACERGVDAYATLVTALLDDSRRHSDIGEYNECDGEYRKRDWFE